MFNNFMGGFPQQPQQPNFNNGYGYGGMFNGMQPQAPSPKTNVILVTSLEDALSRYAEPNSNMVYFDQDKPLAYNIMTDIQGRKTHKTLDLSEHKIAAAPDAPSGEYVTKADVEEIVRRQIEAAMQPKQEIE